jgi:hypothetical protein
MSDIDAGKAVGAGFSVISRRPLSVLAWGLTVGAFLFIAVLALAPLLQLILAKSGDAQASADLTSYLGAMVKFQTASTAVNLGSIFLRAVIICAVFRAVLTPEASAFAYMRVGMSELFLAVFIFGAAFALVLLILVVAAPFILCVVWLAVAHNVGAAVIVGLVGFVVDVSLAIWLAVRLSLLGPMIVVSREFPLGEAWALTRGRAGSLFLIGLLIVLILLALEIVVFGIAGVLGIGLLGDLPHSQEDLRSFVSRPFGELLAGLAPVLALAWLAISIFAGVASAITSAPWAAAYRQLAPIPGTTPAAASTATSV